MNIGLNRSFPYPLPTPRNGAYRSMWYTERRAAVAREFHAGSFLYFRDDERFESAFYDSLQLRRASADLALASLLKFLDKHYLEPSFYRSYGKRLKKIADQWLWQSGRVFWGEDRRNIYECDDTEMEGVLECPENEWTMKDSVKELLGGVGAGREEVLRGESLLD
jgi:hypothetical protein